MKIYKTTDYGKFKVLLGNRDLNATNVKNLVNAIAEKNLLEHNPIIVNEKFEVVDGQNRLEAARQLNTPIYYTIKDHATIEEAQLMNSHVSKWQMADYLHSYVTRGYEDYKILKAFCDTNKMSVSISLYLLSGASPMTGGGNRGNSPSALLYRFKRGEFKVVNGALRKAETLALQLNELKPYCEQRIWCDRAFITALQKAYQKKPHQVLVDKLKTHGKKLYKRPTLKDYLRDLEDIFNHRTQMANRVQLYKPSN